MTTSPDGDYRPTNDDLRQLGFDPETTYTIETDRTECATCQCEILPGQQCVRDNGDCEYCNNTCAEKMRDQLRAMNAEGWESFSYWQVVYNP